MQLEQLTATNILKLEMGLNMTDLLDEEMEENSDEEEVEDDDS